MAHTLRGEELGLVGHLQLKGAQLIATLLKRMGLLGGRAYRQGDIRGFAVEAQQTLAAQLQLTKLEGFDQIIVGPGIQPNHPITRGRQGRQDQDGKSLAELPNPAEHIDAVPIGKQQVEEEQIRLALLEDLEQGEGTVKSLKRPAVLMELLLQESAHGLVVVEDPHIPGGTTSPEFLSGSPLNGALLQQVAIDRQLSWECGHRREESAKLERQKKSTLCTALILETRWTG
jgi:hypothetical protein